MLRFQSAEVRLSQVENEVAESHALVTSSSKSFLLMEEQLLIQQQERQQQQQQQQPPYQYHQQSRQESSVSTSFRRPSVDNDDILTLLLTQDNPLQASSKRTSRRRGSSMVRKSLPPVYPHLLQQRPSFHQHQRQHQPPYQHLHHRHHPNSNNDDNVHHSNGMNPPQQYWKMQRSSIILQDVYWQNELADYNHSKDPSLLPPHSNDDSPHPLVSDDDNNNNNNNNIGNVNGNHNGNEAITDCRLVHRLAQLAHDPNLCEYTESILYEMTQKLKAASRLLRSGVSSAPNSPVRNLSPSRNSSPAARQSPHVSNRTVGNSNNISDSDNNNNDPPPLLLLLEEQLYAAMTMSLWSVALVSLLPGPECEDVYWGLDGLLVMPKPHCYPHTYQPILNLMSQEKAELRKSSSRKKRPDDDNDDDEQQPRLPLLLRRLVLEWVFQHHHPSDNHSDSESDHMPLVDTSNASSSASATTPPVKTLPRGYPYSRMQGVLLDRTVHAALKLYCHYLATRTNRTMTWLERTGQATKLLWETVGWNSKTMRRTKVIPLSHLSTTSLSTTSSSSSHNSSHHYHHNNNNNNISSSMSKEEVQYYQMAKDILLGNNPSPTPVGLLAKVHAHELLQLVLKQEQQQQQQEQQTVEERNSTSTRDVNTRIHDILEHAVHQRSSASSQPQHWLPRISSLPEYPDTVVKEERNAVKVRKETTKNDQDDDDDDDVDDDSPIHSESTELLSQQDETQNVLGGSGRKARGGARVGNVDSNHNQPDDSGAVDETRYGCCCWAPTLKPATTVQQQ